MPLNAEEKYQQEKFKRKQYARPTLEQLEIARLEQQLQHAQNSLGYFENKTIELDKELNQSRGTINYLNNHVDKLTDQRNQVNGHIALYENHERSAGITLDNIRAVMR